MASSLDRDLFLINIQIIEYVLTRHAASGFSHAFAGLTSVNARQGVEELVFV